MAWLILLACSSLEENDSQSDGEKLQFSHVYSTEMKLGLVWGRVLPLFWQRVQGQNSHLPFFSCSAIHASTPIRFILWRLSTVFLWWAAPSEANAIRMLHGNSLHWKQYWTFLFFAHSIILQSSLQWALSGPLQPSQVICSGLRILLRSCLNHASISSLFFSFPWPASYMSHFAQFRPQYANAQFSDSPPVLLTFQEWLEVVQL